MASITANVKVFGLYVDLHALSNWGLQWVVDRRSSLNTSPAELKTPLAALPNEARRGTVRMTLCVCLCMILISAQPPLSRFATAALSVTDEMDLSSAPSTTPGEDEEPKKNGAGKKRKAERSDDGRRVKKADKGREGSAAKAKGTTKKQKEAAKNGKGNLRKLQKSEVKAFEFSDESD